MLVFGKKLQKKKPASKNEVNSLSPDSDSKNSTKTKKKIRIGFARKEKKKSTEKENHQKEVQKESSENSKLSQPEKKIKEMPPDDLFSTDIDPVEILKTDESQKGKEKEWGTTKRRVVVQHDMKGKPVFLEDTGEKIGTIFDVIYDGNKNLIGYKIKDEKSDSILSFPLDQFDEDKSGLIFVPSWYTKGIKTIEKLEFKDRISPELTWLINDKTISTEELYDIFVKHDDEIDNYIEESVALRELLTKRLTILEKERIKLKESLMDLTEKRLIKDIDRRKFSDVVMQHRRKVNILDVNISKCKELIERLETTSFGILSKNLLSRIEKENESLNREDVSKPQESPVIIEKQIDTPYKDKFVRLQERYKELEEEHNELKVAVEKLIGKNDL